MEREQKKVTELQAYKLACDYYKCPEGFEEIEKEITGSDYEDGGTDYRLIVKEQSTGKFFEMNFTQWDIDNTDYDDETDTIGDRCDLPCTLYEVTQKVITKTIYV